MSKYREVAFEEYPEECHICPEEDDIVVHHIDGDRDNNKVDNLIPVCEECHDNIHKNSEGYEEWATKLPDSSRRDIYTADPNTTPRFLQKKEVQELKGWRELASEIYDEEDVSLTKAIVKALVSEGASRDTILRFASAGVDSRREVGECIKEVEREESFEGASETE